MPDVTLSVPQHNPRGEVIRDRQIPGPFNFWALSSVTLPVKRRAKTTAAARTLHHSLSTIASSVCGTAAA